jgi:hypothetical protein
MRVVVVRIDGDGRIEQRQTGRACRRRTDVELLERAQIEVVRVETVGTLASGALDPGPGHRRHSVLRHLSPVEYERRTQPDACNPSCHPSTEPGQLQPTTLAPALATPASPCDRPLAKLAAPSGRCVRSCSLRRTRGCRPRSTCRPPGVSRTLRSRQSGRVRQWPLRIPKPRPAPEGCSRRGGNVGGGTRLSVNIQTLNALARAPGGWGGIRTHEGLPPGGFQDRCLRPLGHPSPLRPDSPVAAGSQSSAGGQGALSGVRR